MVKLVTPECDFNQKAKPFRLLGVDEQYYEWSDCQGERGTVVAFICNHCPYVQAIISRLVEDVKILLAENIGFVAICSNDAKQYPEDSFEKMQQFARQHQLGFPYLQDETQEVARAYGAICTPDFFGYSSDLKLCYRGRLDEAGIRPAFEGMKHELVEAMRLVAKTGQGPRQQFASQGCSIKWR